MGRNCNLEERTKYIGNLKLQEKQFEKIDSNSWYYILLLFFTQLSNKNHATSLEKIGNSTNK